MEKKHTAWIIFSVNSLTIHILLSFDWTGVLEKKVYKLL